MAEWFKALPWKGSEGEIPPQVQILSLPHVKIKARRMRCVFIFARTGFETRTEPELVEGEGAGVETT